jgi:phosphatidylglycerophosphate synthase
VQRLIPNLLSISRIFLGAAIMMLYTPGNRILFTSALVLTAIVVATDVLDGYLARKWGTATEEGYILDGLGDRGFYVALILTMVAAHQVSLVLAWLLIFREVMIYALRLMNRDEWTTRNRHVRPFSVMHAVGIRLWLLSFYATDAARVYWNSELFSDGALGWMQSILACLTVAVAYWSILLTARARL